MSTHHRLTPAQATEHLLAGKALIDVRAPVEFLQGHFPCATNIPLLDDDERQQVGICYKQQGNAAATALGHQLISGTRRNQLLADWQTFIAQNPDSLLYCFRGGQRSQISQLWLAELGIDMPIIDGGYKALRRHLTEQLSLIITERPLIVIGGRTGVRKTALIRELATGIDLEGHANHRGSAFGKQPTPQPTQINFEHQLIIDLLRRSRASAPGTPLFFEDEGRNVGSVSIPLSLREALLKAPIWMIDASLASRAAEICRAYVQQPAVDYQTIMGAPEGIQRHRESLLIALSKIQRRLGHERYDRIKTAMIQALDITHPENATGNTPVLSSSSLSAQNFTAHLPWITTLLRDYYDPMYDYQRTTKAERVAFEGNWQAVLNAANK